MSKVTVANQPTYRIELSEYEARVLKGILGKLTGASEDNLADLYMQLSNVGVEGILPKADIFTAIRRGT